MRVDLENLMNLVTTRTGLWVIALNSIKYMGVDNFIWCTES